MFKQSLSDDLFNLADFTKRSLHVAFHEAGITMPHLHINALFVIIHNQPCTAIKLSQLVSRDKAQITRLLNSLVEQKLVKKLTNPEDSRSQFLKLTAEGEKVLKQIKIVEKPVLAEMTQGLTAREIKLFSELTTKMKNNLSKLQ